MTIHGVHQTLLDLVTNLPERPGRISHERIAEIHANRLGYTTTLSYMLKIWRLLHIGNVTPEQFARYAEYGADRTASYHQTLRNLRAYLSILRNMPKGVYSDASRVLDGIQREINRQNSNNPEYFVAVPEKSFVANLHFRLTAGDSDELSETPVAEEVAEAPTEPQPEAVAEHSDNSESRLHDRLLSIYHRNIEDVLLGDVELRSTEGTERFGLGVVLWNALLSGAVAPDEVLQNLNLVLQEFYNPYTESPKLVNQKQFLCDLMGFIEGVGARPSTRRLHITECPTDSYPMDIAVLRELVEEKLQLGAVSEEPREPLPHSGASVEIHEVFTSSNNADRTPPMSDARKKLFEEHLDSMAPVVDPTEHTKSFHSEDSTRHTKRSSWARFLHWLFG